MIPPAVRGSVLLLLTAAALALSSCAAPPTGENGLEASVPATGRGPARESPVPTETSPPPVTPPELTREEKEALYIEELIRGMELPEMVAQLFILELGGEITKPADGLGRFIEEAGAGGYMLFGGNISTVEGTRALTGAISNASKIAPFICVDEEGGTVSRLFSGGLPGYEAQPSARNAGASGDAERVYRIGEYIGSALEAIGVNVNFAPVADVLTDPGNRVIGSRSYGSCPDHVSDMVSAFQRGLHSRGIMTAPKHFPGHGNTAGDSHFTSAVVASDRGHLAAVEYPPFIRAIGEGAQFIMTGHVIAPEADPGGLPATLSRYFMTDVLRGELGFEGIIVTDAMNMRAITARYGPDEAAVMAIEAGVDMILAPADFHKAAEGILKAVGEGVLSEERIEESVRRILRTKSAAGLVEIPYL